MKNILIDIENLFRATMACNFISYHGEIIADGKVHRFHVVGDKPQSRNGWFVLYLDGIPSGAFGSWKTGISVKWCAKNQSSMSRNEWIEYCNRMQNICHQRNQAKALEQQRVAERASKIWSNARVADLHHPYLLKKRISPFFAKQYGSSLVLPVIDFDEQIWSLQFINCDGSKKLLLGGAKKGHFISVNGSLHHSQLLICEGYATGATLAQAYPEKRVIAAIDAGNLELVAISARHRWPNAEIIICADDDRQTIGNPGATKGKRAAIAARALFTIPHWPSKAPDSLTDFNDLACWVHCSQEVATWTI